MAAAGRSRRMLRSFLRQTHPLTTGNLTLTSHLRILTFTRGAVAHLGERYNRTVEARGSSPLSSTGTPNWTTGEFRKVG
jgi:hypothetical protein